MAFARAVMRGVGCVIVGLCWSGLSLASSVDTRIPVTLASGHETTLLLRGPAEVAEPLPVVIVFGGFESSERTLDYLPTDRAIWRATFPYPWEAPENVGITRVPAILRGFRTAVDDTFDGIRQLLEVLRARPDVDPDRIVLVGASAGAPFATIAGAREQVPGVVIVQGYGRLGLVIGHQFRLSLEKRYGAWVRPLTSLLGHGIAAWTQLPEPEDAARRFTAEQQVLVVNAADDERIPATAIEALWSAVDESPAYALRVDRPGGHLRGEGDPEILALMGVAFSWMEDAGLLPRHSQP